MSGYFRRLAIATDATVAGQNLLTRLAELIGTPGDKTSERRPDTVDRIQWNARWTAITHSQGTSVAYPGIFKGTGHCIAGRILSDGRWSPQIGDWLIRRFFACRVAQQGFWGSCWRVLLYVFLKYGHVSALRTGWAPQSQRYRACPECPHAGYATEESIG